MSKKKRRCRSTSGTDKCQLKEGHKGDHFKDFAPRYSFTATWPKVR
jgi:hypothetical protein